MVYKDFYRHKLTSLSTAKTVGDLGSAPTLNERFITRMDQLKELNVKDHIAINRAFRRSFQLTVNIKLIIRFQVICPKNQLEVVIASLDARQDIGFKVGNALVNIVTTKRSNVFLLNVHQFIMNLGGCLRRSILHGFQMKRKVSHVQKICTLLVWCAEVNTEMRWNLFAKV